MAAGVSITEFHGEEGEDYLFFAHFGRESRGFYVDVGALDGVHRSASLTFERMGWSGLCVEAHPAFFPLLQANRPGATCIHAALVDRPGASTVQIHADELGLAHGTFEPDRKRLLAACADYQLKECRLRRVAVPARTLDDIIAGHAADRRAIDLLALDSGGDEIAILQSFDWATREVKALLVRAEDEAERTALAEALAPHGFVRSRVFGRRMVFARDAVDAMFLNFRRIDCRIADARNPFARETTPARLRGRDLKDGRFWFTDNVLCQQSTQPLGTILDYPLPAPVPVGRLVHVVNLFGRDGAPLDSTQQATVASMAEAARHDGGPHLLLNAQFADESDLTPTGFERTADLRRSSSDMASFAVPRRLPAMFDILDAAAEQAGPDDHIVFTNADICLQPTFYRSVRELLAMGFDTLVINRRTVLADHAYGAGSRLAEAEIGATHPGFDCFIFPRRDYDRYVRSDALVGVPSVALSLLYNMVARSRRMLVLRNVALTYHHGDDRSWRSAALDDYARFNVAQAKVVVAALVGDPAMARRLVTFEARNLNRPLSAPAT